MTMRAPVTALLSLPGCTHNFELHGHPEAGDTYLRSGLPAVDLFLGDRIDGTAWGRPRLTATSLAELDELDAAVQQARERLALWFAGREAVA